MNLEAAPARSRQPSARRPKSFSWRACGLTFIAISFLAIAKVWPPLPHQISLTIERTGGDAHGVQPIVVTGEMGDGDLLVMRDHDDHHVTFDYDAWGAGGPHSAEVTVRNGEKHRLDLEMPSLYELPGVSTRAKGHLRLVFDGRVILDDKVSFHRRRPSEIYFGKNAIGGSADAVFQGTIQTVSGRVLSGSLSSFFPWSSRVWLYLRNPQPIIGVLLLALAAGALWPVIIRCFPVVYTDPNGRGTAGAGWYFALVAILAVAGFWYLITDESFIIRFPESFGVFYDYQALSLLHGHLDVPENALSGESFFYGGKCYGYFGPTPALLRLPLMLFGVGIGVLSRGMMVLEYIACLAAIYAVLKEATRMRRGTAAKSSVWTMVNFAMAGALGSTLFYLSSRAYIYHEAILCGAAFALWSAYCTLRYLDQPGSGWWIGAIACGTLSVHARPPTGLFALAFVGAVAATNVMRIVLRRTSRTEPGAPVVRGTIGRHLLIGIGSILGVLSFNGLSYLKFHTIEGCPLRYNVQYNANRLARIDGKQFHTSNLKFGLDSYVLQPSVKFTSDFPYIATNGPSPNAYSGAKIDMAEPMAGLPYAMPALSLLAALSLVGCWRSTVSGKLAVATAWFAVVPTAIAMFAAIAVSHRYTADFVPFLVVAAAFGILAIEPLSGALGMLIKSAVTLLCLWSVIVTLALTVRFQGEGVWGTPAGTHERFLHWRDRADHWVHEHAHHG